MKSRKKLRSKTNSGKSYPIFEAQLRQLGLPPFVREFRFAPGRKFKADYAWPEHGLLVEIEGGIFTGRAHGSITGILRDIKKYNLAAHFGYHVLRYTPQEAERKSYAAEDIKAWFESAKIRQQLT